MPVTDTSNINRNDGINAARDLTQARLETICDPKVLVDQFLSNQLNRDIVAAVVHFSMRRFEAASTAYEASIAHNAGLSWFGRLFYSNPVIEPEILRYAANDELVKAFRDDPLKMRQALKGLVEAGILKEVCAFISSLSISSIGFRVNSEFKQPVIDFLAQHGKSNS